jgi:diguanylate cyclase (GGDEF)-like protein
MLALHLYFDAPALSHLLKMNTRIIKCATIDRLGAVAAYAARVNDKRVDLMKEILFKRSSIVPLVLIIIFGCVSWFSLESINQLQGNARVINYMGIVRGGTQRLVKKELMGVPDVALEKRLESIVTELRTGVGPNNLIVLPDPAFLVLMNQVNGQWSLIREEIANVRQGGASTRLYELSELYFMLTDKTVSAAEAYTERQVGYSKKILVSINVVFGLFILGWIIFFLRALAVKRRADMLNKIAYIDALTQIPNRSSCEKKMEEYAKQPPADNVVVWMADMNNLKAVNDYFGHVGGDKIITDFAHILNAEAKNYGFVGRYGGDEFVGIFEKADDSTMDSYLSGVNEKVVAHNILQMNDLEKISFAIGHVIGNLAESSLEEMIDEADKKMYIRKRQMKENM